MTYSDARRVLYHMTGRDVVCRKPFRREFIYESEGEVHGVKVWFYVFLHSRSQVSIHITILPCESYNEVIKRSVWYWGAWREGETVDCVDEQRFLARALHHMLS